MKKVEFLNFTGRSKNTGLMCHMDYKHIDVTTREQAEKIIEKEKKEGSTWEECHIYEVLR